MIGAKQPVIVADSDYGLGREAWDKEAWGLVQFRAVMNLATTIGVSAGEDGTNIYTARVIIFATCSQLSQATAAIEEHPSWRYRLLTWVKGNQNGEGRKFITDTEHVLVAWHGNEADVVTNLPEPNGPDSHRYSTALKHDRVSSGEKLMLEESGQPVNPYQKPLSLMRQLLDMFAPLRGSLVIDVTCGTGSTAVSPRTNVVRGCVAPKNVYICMSLLGANNVLLHPQRWRPPGVRLRLTKTKRRSLSLAFATSS